MGKLLIIFALIGAVLCMVKCDDSEDIKELCKNSDDLKKCVRDYFRKNGHCDVIENPTDDPISPGRLNAYVPKINTSLGLTDVQLTHFENKLETFHINKKSGNLVLSLNFKGISLESDRVHFAVYRRSKEPLKIIEHAQGTYPVIITAVFPTSTDISKGDVLNATYYAYIAHPGETKFSVGPKFVQSDVPEVAQAAKQLAENIPTVLQELFLTGAPNFLISYLQNFICDFGVKVSKLNKALGV